ncbi:hypothetical protein [Actinomadura rugatobispora]|uniref:Uncharacterized protein n=1 Tax=Actinomadura rugatobispora TaxID=1994 RepID=A0ABW1A8Y6_9ACTN|nr:hypothetical protein GCM10010200_070630 [Actinomadura rugatobispora]
MTGDQAFGGDPARSQDPPEPRPPEARPDAAHPSAPDAAGTGPSDTGSSDTGTSDTGTSDTGTSGAEGVGAGDVRSGEARPAFLPPMDGHPPHPFPAYPPPPYDPASQGAVWNVAVILAGSLLLVSAFLPWAEARIVVDIFGRTLTRELGSIVGVEADTVVAAVPVLATVAIAMAFWGLIGRDVRVSALGAVPGMLSLLVCGVFVLRLDDLKDRLAATELSVGYEVAAVIGWYLAVAMSLLVIGFSLARPVAARIGAARHERSGAEQYPSTPPQEAGAAWPQQSEFAQPEGPQWWPTQPMQAQPAEAPQGGEAEAPAGQPQQRPVTGDSSWQKPD